MLVIRSSQMSVLNRVQFERWLRGQLTQNFSGRARALGPEGLRAWVSLGVDRAVALGFTEEREMGLYVTLMFLLGRDFEGDPRFAEVAARTIVGCQDQDVRAGPAQARDSVALAGAEVQVTAQVNPLATRHDCLKTNDPVRRNRRPLAGRSVAHQQCDGHRGFGLQPIRTRLQPEVVRCCDACVARDDHEGEEHKSQRMR